MGAAGVFASSSRKNGGVAPPPPTNAVLSTTTLPSLDPCGVAAWVDLYSAPAALAAASDDAGFLPGSGRKDTENLLAEIFEGEQDDDGDGDGGAAGRCSSSNYSASPAGSFAAAAAAAVTNPRREIQRQMEELRDELQVDPPPLPVRGWRDAAGFRPCLTQTPRACRTVKASGKCTSSWARGGSASCTRGPGGGWRWPSSG